MLVFLVLLILLFLVGKSFLNMTLAAAGGLIGLVLVVGILFLRRRNRK